MKKRIFLSFIFMLLGLLIYYLFHINYLTKSNHLFRFVRNYVPDICWSFSFYFLSINFAKNIFKNDILINGLFVLLIAILCEFLQLAGFVGGTFDIFDILIYIISITLSLILEKFIRSRENEKNS